MWKLWLIALILAVPFASAHAGASLESHCENGAVEITVQFVFMDPPADWVGLVVTRDWVGLCDLPTVLNETPWPIPLFPEMPIYNLTDDTVGEDRFFHYSAAAVDADGNLHGVGPNGDSLHWDFAACGTAVAARGHLYTSGSEILYEPCPDTCWGEICSNWNYMDLSGIDPAVYMPYVDTDTPVDIYGDPVADGMPGSPCMIVTDVLPTENGLCGPVPNTDVNWGSLKGMYR